MSKKRLSVLGLALGALVLGLFVGLMTVGTVAADPTPGVRFQIPRIDKGDVLGTGDWETWIQVQNLADVATGAIFVGWGEYSEICPTNDPGIIHHYCQLIQGNALWTLKSQLHDDVKSGVLYTVPASLFKEACQASELTEGDTEAWRCWEEEWRYGTCEDTGGGWADPPGGQGEKVAVTVTRYGMNDHGTFVSSTYTGISDEMDGEGPPWEYYAPYVMHGYNGLDTELTIQNSGTLCTSVWVDYLEQGSCGIRWKEHIEQLAPGEAVRLRVPAEVNPFNPPTGCYWLGSAHISAEQPLGIIVDETSFEEPCLGPDPGTLLTHRARPKIEFREGQPIEDTKVYADLIFREWSGWDASIQVQNLSRTGQNTFVTVDFLDNSGDEILFLADWICPTGSATFYLPIVTNLGFDYIGAAEIESHDQVNYPGGETPAQPIFAVVDLKKPDNPLTPALDAQGGSYNAHPYSQKEWVSEIALPFIAKDGEDMYTPWTSMIAIRNNSNCNKIKPRIEFTDETGTLMCRINSFWMMPKQIKFFDLNNIGCLHAGYIGAATVIVEEFEQLCDTDNDGHTDNTPLMPSVIVVEKGFTFLGDATTIYEGVPFATNIPACSGTIFGTATVRQADHGFDLDTLRDVQVWIDGVDTGETTDSTGGYLVRPVDDGDHEVTFVRPADLLQGEFFDLTFDPFRVDCGDEELLDAELICANPLTVTVEDTTGNPIPQALVKADVTFEVNGEGNETYMTEDVTNNAGVALFNVAGAGDIDLEVTAAGHDPLLFGAPPEVPEHGGAEENEDCRDEPFAGVQLCKYNAIVGTVTIGGQPAVGYTAEAVDMSVNPPAVVDSNITTAGGVFSLQNFSNAHATYRINLYTPLGTSLSTTGNFDVSRCGGTAVISYTSGVWTGLPLVWTGGNTP